MKLVLVELGVLNQGEGIIDPRTAGAIGEMPFVSSASLKLA